MAGKGIGHMDTTELFEHYGTARRVRQWTTVVDRMEPVALGRAADERAGMATFDQAAVRVGHLAGGFADEGFDTRVEE